MRERTENYVVNAPEEFIGDVCGELSNRGGLIVAMNDNRGVYEIRAQMPIGSMTAFESWLAKTTFDRGSMKRIDG